MTRELVIHVGLPKTATTSIQTLLSHHLEDLTAAGVECRSVKDNGAHHVLADALLRLDGRGWPEFFHDSVRGLVDCWPVVGEADRVLVSAEDLWIIGPNGIDAVTAHAERIDASIVVVVVVRSPVDWAWSLWTELTKSRPVDWVEFVEDLSSRRLGTIGEIVRSWSRSDRVRSVEVIDFHSPNFVLSFLDRFAARGVVDREEVGSVVENTRVGVVEAMYRAAYTRTVLEMLGDAEMFGPIRPTEGLAERLLLDAVALSRPMSETAEVFGLSIDRLVGSPFSPLGSDSIPVLIEYCEMIASDADALAGGSGGLLGADSRAVARAHARRARAAAGRLLEDGGSVRFPNRHFEDRLPIDGRFLESARQTAGLVMAAASVVDRTHLHGIARGR